MTITIDAHPASNHYTAEARTKSGIVELRAYVEGLA